MSQQFVVDCKDCDKETVWGSREHAETDKQNHEIVNPHTAVLKPGGQR